MQRPNIIPHAMKIKLHHKSRPSSCSKPVSRVHQRLGRSRSPIPPASTQKQQPGKLTNYIQFNKQAAKSTEILSMQSKYLLSLGGSLLPKLIQLKRHLDFLRKRQSKTWQTNGEPRARGSQQKSWNVDTTTKRMTDQLKRRSLQSQTVQQKTNSQVERTRIEVQNQMVDNCFRLIGLKHLDSFTEADLEEILPVLQRKIRQLQPGLEDESGNKEDAFELGLVEEWQESSVGGDSLPPWNKGSKHPNIQAQKRIQNTIYKIVRQIANGKAVPTNFKGTKHRRPLSQSVEATISEVGLGRWSAVQQDSPKILTTLQVYESEHNTKYQANSKAAPSSQNYMPPLFYNSGWNQDCDQQQFQPIGIENKEPTSSQIQCLVQLHRQPPQNKISSSKKSFQSRVEKPQIVVTNPILKNVRPIAKSKVSRVESNSFNHGNPTTIGVKSSAQSVHSKVSWHNNPQRLISRRNSDLGYNKKTSNTFKAGKVSSVRVLRQTTRKSEHISSSKDEYSSTQPLIEEIDHIDQIPSVEQIEQEQLGGQMAARMAKIHPGRPRRMKICIDNDMDSQVMLNQLQDYYLKSNPASTKLRAPSRQKDFHPKYLYVDSSKSFVHNTMLISDEIERMHSYLEANNCGMDSLLQCVQNQKKVRSQQLNRRWNVSSKDQEFDFIQIRREPVFLEINQAKIVTEQPQNNNNYNVPHKWSQTIWNPYRQDTPRKSQWVLFDQPIPPILKDQELIQTQMQERVRVVEMARPCFQLSLQARSIAHIA